jgi:hypothetical protein
MYLYIQLNNLYIELNIGVCLESIQFESRGSNLSSDIYQYGFARGYARVSSNGKYRYTGGNTGGMEIPVEWKYRWN